MIEMATVSDVFNGFDCTIIGNASEEVKGLAYRSDCVKPGDVFFCIVGLKVDGHSFAGDAINRGASVIVAERKLYVPETVLPGSQKRFPSVWQAWCHWFRRWTLYTQSAPFRVRIFTSPLTIAPSQCTHR